MKPLRIVIPLLYVGFVAWSLYGAVVPVETYLFRMVHMAFIFALAFPGLSHLEEAPPWATLAGSWAWRSSASPPSPYALLDLDQFIRRSTLPGPRRLLAGDRGHRPAGRDLPSRRWDGASPWSWSGSCSTPTSATTSPARWPTRGTTWTGSSATRT